MKNSINILIFQITLCVISAFPVYGDEDTYISWGDSYQGLSLGISLEGSENIPQGVAYIFLWAKINYGKVPPKINPLSIKLMNYAPEDKIIKEATAHTFKWDKFYWEKVEENLFKSRLLKVSSEPSGKWGIGATIPVDWKGQRAELKTGIIKYTVK